MTRPPRARPGAAAGTAPGAAASAERVVLVTGGARSGKSRYALELAAACRRPVYLATAEPLDEEMRRRIDRHRAERGEGWTTVEEAIDPAAALDRLPSATDVAVVDCLTVWLGNLVHRAGRGSTWTDLADPAAFPEIAALLSRLGDPPCRLILIGNEVGWGIVPESALGRAFRDLAGRVNQEVARRADRVVLMVAGRPLELPGGRGG